MTNDGIMMQLEHLLQQQDRDNGNEQVLFRDFVAAYFRQMRAEQLGERTAEELLAVAQTHFELARERADAVAAVRIVPLQDSRHGCDLALLTVARDMPFIVETVRMAVRNSGAAIDWVIHPVLHLERDQQGRLTSVASVAEQTHGDSDESLLYIEFAASTGFAQTALVERVEANLGDLAIVVADYQPMREQLRHVMAELEAAAGANREECAEVQAFLDWLDDHHFTFLGYRLRTIETGDGDATMVDVPGSSLGLLREERPYIDPDGYVAPAEELDKYVRSSRILVVAKANAHAWIHHPEPMDVIAVKHLDGAGQVLGAHRFLGLFSAKAYAASPRDIPVLRHKLSNVVQRAGFKPGSNDAKTLRYIFATLPRDELFQSSEDELFTTALGVLAMRESAPLRLFLRRDRYGRFYSCLVYIPRDRYSSNLRRILARELERLLSGEASEADVMMLRGGRTRLHYLIATQPGAEPMTADAIEQELRVATRSWPDAFAAAAGRNDRRVAGYAHAFSAAYMERVAAPAAVADARILAKLVPASRPLLTLDATGADERGLLLRLFGSGAETALSDVLPILENFGLTVRTQLPFSVHAPDGERQWIHEFEAAHPQAQTLRDEQRADYLADMFALVSSGGAENDCLNRLVISAGLSPREVMLVRTITRYLLQTNLPFSARYLETLLADHARIVAECVVLFGLRFDPDGERDEQRRVAVIQQIEEQFESVSSRDADRALRAFFGVMLALLRTNYYQRDAQGQPKDYVSIKLDPAQVPELPQPVPAFETFVYAPEVEGVHLRGGLVSRGGLRWSDRQADFRTEVLGLMKTQMIKNAVIVPVGAKGGFVVKNAPADEAPEAAQARGTRCYQTFLRGLLDITDNRGAEGIEHPERVVRHDGDDPYLVVAADKGTAGFSDIANALAREYGYWLDDAFASGGSAGYDHKGMGITARGAWESVERHFRELGHDTQAEPFTVVGIGDMAGDVFGNGMLCSEQIRLLAAFNHMHVFIDPNPDPGATFAERKRLFELGRSAWSDYDSSLISTGGGIYERSAKHIELSDEAMQALGIRCRRLTPEELIRNLLLAPVDLLWNGGIGTYVKASSESHADVGDRANDSLRVDGRDLRCRVVGEGGNLGMTQAGRIEFALAGGHLNTDAIDNSGGVDSSDMEVNIKIALRPLEMRGELEREQRNRLLHAMTEDVAALVLRTNYLQTQQISLLARDSVAHFDEQLGFMRTLERADQIARDIDGLPNEDVIAERRRNQQGLTRPELAVLLSHAKIALHAAVIDSDLPDDPALEPLLLASFPQALQDDYADAIRAHGLRRELVTTLITNQMVNRLGIVPAHRLAADHGVALAAIVRTYVLADAWLGAEALYREVEALDDQAAVEIQYPLLQRIGALVMHVMNWQLATGLGSGAASDLIERYQEPTQRLLEQLPGYVTGAYAEHWQHTCDAALAGGLAERLARHMASVATGGGLMDMVALAQSRQMDVAAVAGIYFTLGDELGLAWLHQALLALQVDGYWPTLARSNLRGDCFRVHRQLVTLVLADGADVHAWLEHHAAAVETVRNRIEVLQGVEKLDFAHLSVALRALSQLRDTCTQQDA
ncbi:MAG TPA: NAD-glutamate dehydrogenase [Salinisphaeraceae bacterium]|nr:NAD-glutamate dehydrogenase [Salinisphaeraceae bacterium]